MPITKLMDGLPNPSMAQADFDQAVGKYMADLPAWGAEANALEANVNAKEVSAAQSAVVASTKAGDAASSADSALASKNAAATQAGNSATKAGEAAASAVAAANAAAALVGTSSTLNTIATGPMVFLTQAGKQFQSGVDMKAVSASNSANAVYGKVAAYAGTSLTINVTSYDGVGDVSDWNLAVVGQRGPLGPAGGIAGGNCTGAINEAKGADVASAAMVDVWSGNGNYEVLIGAAAIIGFTAAPQAGARRRVLVGGTPTLTAGANLIIKGVQSGLSFTCAAGDEIDVWAETTTKFRVTITKGDGTAMAALYGAFQIAMLLTGTGTYVAKKTAWHRITLVGGSARAGMAVSGGAARATGSSGAGYCVGMVFLIAGQSYSYIQGSGAAASSTLAIGASGAIQGADGGASSFFGAGIPTLTANGGIGGLASVGSTATLTGPQGGTASGGYLNVQGGKAGDVSGAGSGKGASGGGAVGIMGAGFASGDAVVTTGNPSASGGAGVGGGSGTATNGASGGGGFGGPSTPATNTATNGGPNYTGVGGGTPAQASTNNFLSVLLNATSGGGNANGTAPGDRSGGGAGGYANSTAPSQSPGTFAGGGGYGSLTDNSVPNSSGGNYGGGQGGAAVPPTTSVTLTVPACSPGMVMVES
ncbi:hypothetical protein GTP58_24405 [Duganella sp. CY15W]|uniref:hypothetical protein n=1 Tax=Duganella sp. CY15W TaxID=2692172 RepID=UPI00137228D5|nr:hypothetical protein [Duganella sp. CY15W]MYM31480.1 hypothetical protein [Duganella sp. CY15W]